MNILQVIPYFTPRRGGDVNTCRQISKRLAARHNVTILTTDFELDEGYAEEMRKDCVEVVACRCATNLALFLISPSTKSWLAGIRKYDIVHMHSFRSYQNNLVFREARRSGIPYILQAHGSVLPRPNRVVLKVLYDLCWGKSMLKSSSKVFALTPTEAEQYKLMGVDNRRIEIIPTGISSAEYSHLPPKGRFRDKWNVPEGNGMILYVGRIDRTKGLDLLIETFSEILQKDGDAKLILVGPDNGYQSHLEKEARRLKIRDNVVFTGFLKDCERTEAYVDADVFVTPSYIGFPATFLEACASGTPIVTTRNGDRLDWIDGKVGVVAEYDKTSLEEAIVGILENQNKKDMLGEEGRRLAQDVFDWDKITRNVEGIYEALKGQKDTIAAGVEGNP